MSEKLAHLDHVPVLDEAHGEVADRQVVDARAQTLQLRLRAIACHM